jgi:hypothetical protein
MAELKQLLRSPRRNVPSVELIDGPSLMRHEHLAGTLVKMGEDVSKVLMPDERSRPHS